MNYHQNLDRRSQAMHCLVAEKLRQHPELWPNVNQTLTHFEQVVSASAQPYLKQWRFWVDQGMDYCLQRATEDSEEATVMRQSSPFGGILTHRERFAFLREWKDKYESSRA